MENYYHSFNQLEVIEFYLKQYPGGDSIFTSHFESIEKAKKKILWWMDTDQQKKNKFREHFHRRMDLLDRFGAEFHIGKKRVEVNNIKDLLLDELFVEEIINLVEEYENIYDWILRLEEHPKEKVSFDSLFISELPQKPNKNQMEVFYLLDPNLR